VTKIKGTILGYGGILIVLLLTSFAIIWVTATGPASAVIATKEGNLISFRNKAELLMKSLEQNIEFVAQRAAYNLGKTGGIRGSSVSYWNADYPKFNDLQLELEREIEINLPQNDIKNDVEIKWMGSYISVYPYWKLVGDVNFDNIVDMADASICVAAYGSSPGDANWEKTCDFNDDNEIDLFDLVRLATNYGRTNADAGSEVFEVSGYKNFSIYSKSVDTTISIDQKIKNNASSYYFEMIAIGRKIVEDSRYNILFSDLNALENLLREDFKDLNFSLTDQGTYIDVLIKQNDTFNCIAGGQSFCLAPLRPGETGITIGGNSVLYDYLKLNFRIKKSISVPTSKYAFISDSSMAGAPGLRIIDVSNPASPVIVGSLDTTGSSIHVYVSGKYAYLADWLPGLEVIDISNPTSPVLVGSIDTGEASGVYVVDNYAYVADDLALKIVDVSVSTNPIIFGSVNLPSDSYDIYVSEDYAYVADKQSGLQIVDVSNPASPVIVGSADTSGIAYGVYVSGKYAYVADGTNGLQIVNVSMPSNPIIVGSLPLSYSTGVYVSGRYAYVADMGSGLRIIDVSNPVSPVLVGTIDTPGNARGVFIVGKYAYVADGGSGLEVIDVSNPASPVIVGSVNTPSEASSIYVSTLTTEATQCSDGTDNDGDGLIDDHDPGCLNDGVYNPSDTDEKACEPSCDILLNYIENHFGKMCGIAGYNHTADLNKDKKVDGKDNSLIASHCNDNAWCNNKLNDNSIPCECGDTLDNDTDTKIDSADEYCHTDFNAANVASYDSYDDSECGNSGEACTMNAECCSGLNCAGGFCTSLSGPLTVSLTLTPAPSVYNNGELITFDSSTSGGIAPYSYSWNSNIDGIIGNTKTFNKNDLTVGDHTITLTVTDPAGHSTTDSLVIHVLPTSFDWRNKNGQNWMTSVKVQGCGDCWAFAALGIVEAKYNIQNNNPNLDIDLSEQYLVSDCCLGGSCSGGSPLDALNYIKTDGVPDELCYTYLGMDSLCGSRCTDWNTRLWTINNYNSVSGTKAIKYFLINKGPISAVMSMALWNPITHDCPAGASDHGVVIAGYDDTQGVWIVKNSWGIGFEDNGYFKVKYESCNIESGCTYIDNVITP